jgi:CIC family chloride channel protein
MAALAVAKMATSALSLGCGAPGGVFGPIFFIGAMSGGTFRGLSALVFPHLTGPRGSYALVGLGAFLAATTHAPLTAIFLLFEMTQNYSVTVPALITAGIALMIATRLEPDSIDTLGLTAEGKSLHPSSERTMLEHLPIGDAYRRDVDTIPEAASFTDVLRIVGGSRSGTFPVVDAGGMLRGVLSSIALRTILLEHDLDRVVIAADLADPNVPTLTPDDTLGAAFRLMEAEGLDDVPVVEPADRRRLLGMLSRGDLLAAYNRAVASIGALGTWLTATGGRRAGRFRVAVLPVPPGWIGRSLREVDVRARFAVTVLAVERDGRADGGYELPDPDRPLAATDRLVVAGTDDALRHAGAA